MTNPIEEAINGHIHQRSQSSLQDLYQALLAGDLLIPVFAEVATDASGRTDVPVTCVRLPTGEGCIPAFTSVSRLLEWKKMGSEYVQLPGKTLFKMAADMPEIDCVYVNYSDQQGAPKGKVTRLEFEKLAQVILPATME